jgi:hypothetical protein
MNRPGPSLNGSASLDGTTNDIPIVLKEMLKGGLALLWRGFEYARDLDAEYWEFAVGCDVLYQAGLSAIDLRWLIARGYVESAPKVNQANGRRGDGKNAFILTKAGAALAWQVLARTMPPVPYIGWEKGHASPYAPVELKLDKQKPRWDRDRKELRLGEYVIKQFRWAAVNQETILMAFEEEEWTTRIDDPLPQNLNQDPKCRLHDTIKCLNRNHKKRLIHFSGDGTGEGILWTLLDGAEFDA